MRSYRLTILFIVFCGLISFTPSYFDHDFDERILSYEVNPIKQELKFYWKNNQGENYSNAAILKSHLKKQHKELVFAVNGGMYMKDQTPLGLFVEKGVVKRKLNRTKSAYGNFYMQPNGVFYLTKSKEARICTSVHFDEIKNVNYATQSGPMLIINGKVHPKFNQNSKNFHIRNGVGILPNGNILFAQSKQPISFYQFAQFFKQKGCRNALYLDGFVSRTYLPSQNWNQMDGNFGVIIAETKSDSK